MMGSSGGKSLSQLSNLVNFLADPEAAKKVIDAHKKAAEDHKQAADEHKEAEAKANDALEELNRKSEELEKHENDLLAKGQGLAKFANDLLEKQKFLDEKTHEIEAMAKQSEERFRASDENCSRIVEQAKAQAAKILADQQIIIKKITDEALQKDRVAEQHKNTWWKKSEESNKFQNYLLEREEKLAKREKFLDELVAKLKG